MNRLYHLISRHHSKPSEAEYLSKSRSILIETILEKQLDSIDIFILDEDGQDALHELLEAFAKLYQYDFVHRASHYRYVYNHMIKLQDLCPALKTKRKHSSIYIHADHHANSFGHPHSTRKNKSKSPLLSKAYKDPSGALTEMVSWLMSPLILTCEKSNQSAFS